MPERAAVLHRLIDAMEARSAEIIDLLVAETGCPRAFGSIAAQFAAPRRMAREIVDLMLSPPETKAFALPARESTSRSGQLVTSWGHYDSLGVVAGSSAYNFPLHTGVWKVVPALIAGNLAVPRPNPLTPLSSLAFAEEAFEAGLPAGVLNIVLEPGSRALG